MKSFIKYVTGSQQKRFLQLFAIICIVGGMFCILNLARLSNAKKISKYLNTLVRSTVFKLSHSEKKLQRIFVRNPFCLWNASVAFVEVFLQKVLQKPISTAK